MPDCSSIQKSLAWCQGKPELPGVKRRIFYISKADILKWPELQHDANGRLKSASYTGDFVLRADAKWKFIDILPDKSQLTSDGQGEYPSQTQLNKLVAVHPGVDEAASAASAYLNNNDNVFLVEDMRGAIRVVGSDKWPTKTVVTQDLGQGPTSTTSTTITVEATDECLAPFYAGSIDTDDGTINPEGNPNQATGGGNSGGQNSGNNSGGGNTSGGGNSSGSSSPTFSSDVYINNQKYTVSKGGNLSITGSLKSLSFSGSNMDYISLEAEGEMEEEIEINNAKNSAVWTGQINGPSVVTVRRFEGTGDNSRSVTWFTLTILAANGPVYDEKVNIEGYNYTITNGRVNAYNYLNSIRFTGQNMVGVYLVDTTGKETKLNISSDGKSASWNGSYTPYGDYKFYRDEGTASSPNKVLWFTLNLSHNDGYPEEGD